MIPKKIHYVWVGGHDKPPAIQRTIAQWHRRLPDYEFHEWNETNFDLEQNAFLHQAYLDRKWAFVSDYIRLSVIESMGGIYLDTDVNVLKSFNSLLNQPAFVGFQDDNHPFTGAAFGAEPHHPFIQHALSQYAEISTESPIDYYTVINTDLIGNLLLNEYGCLPNGREQDLREGIHVYPSGVLCWPSKDSIAIHVFRASWIEKQGTRAQKIKRWLRDSIRRQWQAGLYDASMQLIYQTILHQNHRRV